MRSWFAIIWSVYGLCIFCSILPQRYLYPKHLLASTSVILMRQCSPDTLAVVAWDVQANTAQALLPSYYCPVDVCTRPDNNDITFIDNDRVRIKSALKRSARAYDFQYPLYSITSLVWSDSMTLFFTARYRDHSALFKLLCNERETLYMLAEAQTDYLYPQCIGSTLYYIKRVLTEDGAWKYSIQCMQITDEDESLLQDDDAYLQSMSVSDKATLIDFGELPIMHLAMVHPTFGWVIGVPEDTTTEYITFPCCTVHGYDDGHWDYAYAFSFTVPSAMIVGNGPDRLVESLTPLLPRYICDSLYFCTTAQNGFLGIYQYDLDDKTITRLTSPAIHTHLFAPIDLGDRIICGGGGDTLWQVALEGNCFNLDFLT
jgi:hypothetical protein